MGLHAFTKPDPEKGFTIRFGWICDVCGKEIKDPRDGSIDYTCIEPSVAKTNKRLNKFFQEKHYPEENYFDYIVYHTTTCCPPRKHRYWNYLHKIVNQINLPLTKARKKVH